MSSVVMWLTVILLWLASITAENFGGILVLRDLATKESSRSFTCVSESDDSALIWNYNYTTNVIKTEDFEPQKRNSENIRDCGIWNGTKCHARWDEINEWQVVNSRKKPTAPVLDFRWEGFKELPSKYAVANTASQYVGQVTESYGGAIFSARGTQNVIIFLCVDENRKQGPCFLIVLGANRGTKCMIRFCADGAPPDRELLTERKCSNIAVIENPYGNNVLDPYEWRTFRLTWDRDRKVIQVFKDSDLENEPFLKGETDDWSPVSHVFVKCDKAARVRFHFYDYLLAEKTSSSISTDEFNRYGDNFCVDLLVGLCPKCKLAVTLTNSEDEDIEMGIIDGYENATWDGALTWRSVKLNKNLENFDSNRVKLKVRTILGTDGGKGQWAIDNFRFCDTTGKIRSSTVTVPLETLLSDSIPLQLKCQKLSYSQNAVIDSLSEQTIDGTSNPETQRYTELIESCGSPCENLGERYRICSTIGCTCSRGFSGIRCSTECSNGFYGYDCTEVCGSCRTGPCDKRTGICKAGCKFDRPQLPLCKIDSPIVRNVTDTTATILQRLELAADAEPTNIIVEIEVKITGILQRLQFDLTKSSIPSTYQVDIDKLIFDKKYTALTKVTLTQAERIVTLSSPSTSFTTACFKKPVFILTPEEEKLSVTMKDPKECLYTPTPRYVVVVEDLANNVTKMNQSGLKFPVSANYLLPYTKYRVTISNETTGYVLYSSEIRTLESAPSPVRDLAAEVITDTEVTLRWNRPLKENGIIRNYNVTFSKVRLLACTEQENAKELITLTTNQTAIKFTNLHPYASYKATVTPYTIKPGKTETKLLDTKASAIPTSKIRNLVLADGNNTLRWDKPTNCSTITGPIKVTKLLFKVANDSTKNWEVTEQTAYNFLKLANLKLTSYTEYRVRVHLLRNYRLEVNPDIYEEITWWTPPSEPSAVRNLTMYDADSEEDTISLRWLPPYPANGETESYRMTVISDPRHSSHKNLEVLVEKLKCEPKWEDFVCYKCINIPPDIIKNNIQIEVKAKNKNVKMFGVPAYVLVTSETYNTKPSEPNISTLTPMEFGIVILKWVPPSYSLTKITRFYIEARPVSSNLQIYPNEKSPIEVMRPVDPNQTEYSIELYLLTSTVYNISVVTANHRNITSTKTEKQIAIKGSIAFASEKILHVEQVGNSIKVTIPGVLNATDNTWVTVTVQGLTKCVPTESRTFSSPVEHREWTAAEYKVEDSGPKNSTLGAAHVQEVPWNCSFESGETYMILSKAKDRYSMAEAKLEWATITTTIDEKPQTTNLTWLIIVAILVICAVLVFFGYRNRRILLEIGRKRSSTEILMTPWNNLAHSTPSPSSNNNLVSSQESASDVVRYDPHSCPVKTEEFEKYIQDALTSGLLDSQYKAFTSGLTKACEYGKLPENTSKNRYKDRLAYDDTRVVLKKVHGDPHSDYINASYIRGYKKEKGYIATQGPKPNTVNDFWRMIWQEDVRVICMLANVIEGGKTKCHQYWPEVQCNVEYGNIIVSNTGHEVFVDYTFRTLVISFGKDKRVVTHLHYTGWPDHEVPMYIQSLLPYLKRLQDTAVENSPVVVHCSAGVGRTGTIILCDVCLNRAKKEKIVDLPAETVKMREDRANMIDNARQYLLAHLVIAEYLVSDETLILCNSSLREKIKEMRKKLPSHVERLNDTVWKDRALYPLDFPENHLVTGEVTGDRGSAWVPVGSDPPPSESTPTRDYKSKYLTTVCVDGMRMKNQYIAAPLPSPANWPDLWKRVTDENVELIIILQSPDPDDPTYCSILPDDLTPDPVQQIQVEPKTSEDGGEEEFPIDRLALKGEGAEPQPVTVLTCTGWGCGDKEKPRPPSTLASLWRASEKISRKEGPTFVLCRDGITGCGLYLALSFLLERMAVAGECDVISAVRAVRRYKQEFARPLEQLEYLYDAAIKYDEYFQTYANFS